MNTLKFNCKVFLRPLFITAFLCLTVCSAIHAQAARDISAKDFQCLSFDGIDDVVNAGDNKNFNGSQLLTVEMWVRIDTFSAWRTFFCKFQNLSNRIQFQQYEQAGKIAVCVNNTADLKKEGNQAYFFTPDAEVTIGDWFHLAMVFDGTLSEQQRLKLFINGMNRPLKKDPGAKGAVPTCMPVTKAPLLLGAEKPDGAYGYKGLMDEVRIWTVARTEQQIRDNMETTMTGDEPGLQIYYPMHTDSADPGKLVDLSPSKNHGKLVNFTPNSAIVEREVAIPAVNATSTDVRQAAHNAVHLDWKRGSGSANAVFASSEDTTPPRPEPGVTYTADPVFGKGSRIGDSKWYCVYNGHEAQAQISGLTPSTEYRLAVVDYNGSSGREQYTQTLNDQSILKITTATAPAVAEESPETTKKNDQTITFNIPGEVTLGEKVSLLSATASSGLPVTFILADTAIANVVNGELIVKSSGSTSITARQTGNDQFAAAPDVVRTLTVKKVIPVSSAAGLSKSPVVKRKPIFIAAAGTIVTGVVLTIILAIASSGDDGGHETVTIDRPPNDPVLGIQ
ncbi:MAG TPA: LamG domain-containing protein [Chitinispirillaceae bacterium]|nr:LamG domain-containing protein [Chitinispirillaceae bacterium]